VSAVKLAEDGHVLHLARWMAQRLAGRPLEREIVRMWLIEDRSPGEIEALLGLERGRVEAVRKLYRRYATTADLKKAALLARAWGAL